MTSPSSPSLRIVGASPVAQTHATPEARKPATVETPAGRALRNPPPVCVVGYLPSRTREGVYHVLTRAYVLGHELWGCSCEAGRYRPDRECPHVHALRNDPDAGAQLTPEGYVALGRVAT